MIKKFLQYAMGNFIALFLGFISSPIITRMISPLEMGRFSLFNTVTSLLFLFVMVGTDQAYVRYYNGENDTGRSALLRICLGLSFIVSIVLGIGLAFFYQSISVYVQGKSSLMVVALLIINIFTSVLQRFSLLEVRMALNGKLYSYMNVWQKISYILTVFGMFMIMNDSSYVLIVATIVSNILCFLACVAFRFDVWRHLWSGSLHTVSKRELINYGFPFVFSNAINWIFEYIDRISIRNFKGFSEVGIFSAATTIVALLTSCQLAFTAFWVPVAYEKYEKEKDPKPFFQKANEVVSVVMMLGAVVMVTSKDLIIFLLGPEYRSAMYIFPFLTLMPIMYTISETTVIGINFRKNTKIHIAIAGISAIVNLVLNLALVPTLGAKGAAISTGISYIVFFIARTGFASRVYSVNFNLKAFTLSTTLLLGTTTYCSFNRFDLVTVILGLTSLLGICYAYRKTIREIVTGAFKKFESDGRN